MNLLPPDCPEDGHIILLHNITTLCTWLTYWDCIWIIFEQPERQSEHSLGFHQIHTLPAERRAEGDLSKHKPRRFWTSLLTTCSICDFLLFPELKTALQDGILIKSPHSSSITGCTVSACNSALHKMLCPVAWSQCSLYEVPGRLLKRHVVWWNKFSPETTWVHHAGLETDHSHPFSTANYKEMGHFLYYA
jgi:hypothetical protein